MITEYFLLILILLSVGSLSGFSAGLFGVGGGAVMVPALYYAFNAIGVSETSLMHCAVGTSSSVIIFNSFRAVKSHHDLGAIDWNLLRPKPFSASYHWSQQFRGLCFCSNWFFCTNYWFTNRCFIFFDGNWGWLYNCSLNEYV